MEFNFETLDYRVLAINVSINMSIKEYSDFAFDVMDKNPFQRKRVQTRNRTYLILRNDLLKSCLFPPITLATTLKFRKDNSTKIEELVRNDVWTSSNISTIRNLAQDAIESGSIMILDGLQRTVAIEEVLKKANKKERELLLSRNMRAELYIGLSETGLLYRMLTLNTGQTPMTFRHQIEIVFSDYVDSAFLPKNIQVIREVERKSINEVGKYRFSEVVGLYHAFLTRSPAPMTKDSIISRLAPMDFMEKYDRKLEEDLSPLLEIYNHFVESLVRVHPNWTLSEALHLERPFGKNIVRLFSRSQPMAGFGSASIRCISDRVFTGISHMKRSLQIMNLTKSHIGKGLMELNVVMNNITQRGYRSKIGTMQRAYFEFYFRKILKDWASNSLDLVDCARSALSEMERFV